MANLSYLLQRVDGISHGLSVPIQIDENALFSLIFTGCIFTSLAKDERSYVGREPGRRLPIAVTRKTYRFRKIKQHASFRARLACRHP